MPGKLKHGFIAQALQKVLPTAVSVDPLTSHLMVDLSEVIPFLVRAVQQLTAQATRSRAMEERVRELEEKLRKMTEDTRAAPTDIRQEAKDAFMAKDYSRALLLYNRAVQKETSSYVRGLLMASRAACFYKRLEYRLAVREAERAISEEPSTTKAWLWKAAALVKLHMKEPAVAIACAAHRISLDKLEPLSTLEVWTELFPQISEVFSLLMVWGLTLYAEKLLCGGLCGVAQEFSLWFAATNSHPAW